VREKCGNEETLGCWRERGYFDEEETSGPMDVTQVEKANGTLMQRLLKKWKSRGSGTVKEGLDAIKIDEGEEVPPPYTA